MERELASKLTGLELPLFLIIVWGIPLYLLPRERGQTKTLVLALVLVSDRYNCHSWYQVLFCSTCFPLWDRHFERDPGSPCG